MFLFLSIGPVGFTIEDGNPKSKFTPTVRPYIGWALMLPKDSMFMSKDVTSATKNMRMKGSEDDKECVLNTGVLNNGYVTISVI